MMHHHAWRNNVSFMMDMHSHAAGNETTDVQRLHLIDLMDDFNGAPLVGTCVFFLAMSWLAVMLRTYTRAVIISSLKMDDWLMLVSQIIFTSSCVFVLEGVRKGMGRHNAAIADDDARVSALKWQAVATISYILNMMFIKLSIGVFLLRVSVKLAYKYIIRISLVVIVLWSLGIFIWDIFQCVPVEKQWDYRIEGGRCASPANIVAAAYAISALGITSDWLYALIPIPMLWSVKMSKQAKATVIIILGLGIFASIATLIRFRFLGTLQDSEDLLYSSTAAMIWTIIEPGVAIIASSLATIRPLLRAMRIHGFELDRTSSGDSAAYLQHEQGRAVTCAIRRFGPKDISLRDVEARYFCRLKQQQQQQQEEEPQNVLEAEKIGKCPDDAHQAESSQGSSPSWAGPF